GTDYTTTTGTNLDADTTTHHNTYGTTGTTAHTTTYTTEEHSEKKGGLLPWIAGLAALGLLGGGIWAANRGNHDSTDASASVSAAATDASAAASNAAGSASAAASDAAGAASTAASDAANAVSEPAANATDPDTGAEILLWKAPNADAVYERTNGVDTHLTPERWDAMGNPTPAVVNLTPNVQS
ncbi:MAG: hypothetical protein QM632_06330, partial [Micrococcaceae bacterium]